MPSVILLCQSQGCSTLGCRMQLAAVSRQAKSPSSRPVGEGWHPIALSEEQGNSFPRNSQKVSYHFSLSLISYAPNLWQWRWLYSNQLKLIGVYHWSWDKDQCPLKHRTAWRRVDTRNGFNWKGVQGCWVKENFALCNRSYLRTMMNVIGWTASCGAVFGNVSVL